MEITNIVKVNSRDEWRSWLEKNHATAKFCWLPVTKGMWGASGKVGIPYLDAVEEALCFGWIDSTSKGGYQRFSPRRKGGNWTELNKMRVKRLERLGLMTAAGRAVLPCLETFEILLQILEQLQADPILWENFSKLPETYKRIRLGNIQAYYIEKPTQKWHFGARDTYEKRLQKFIENTRAGILYGDWHDGGRLLEE